MDRKKLTYTIISLLLAIFIWLMPSGWLGIEGLTVVEQRVTAVFVLAALFWVFEIIPIWTTSVLVIALLLLTVSDNALWFMRDQAEGAPPLGTFISYKALMATFADPIIILFLGGFFLAIGAKKCGLDKNLMRVLFKPFGTKSEVVLLGVMVVTALFSMFMSNTATAAMMFVIVAPLLVERPESGKGRIALALAVAVGANIGGMGTPIGTPPNAIALKYLNDPNGLNMGIGFGEWMMLMVPFVIVMIFVSWFILLKLFRFNRRRLEIVFESSDENPAGKFKTAVVYITFAGTVILWMLDKATGLDASVVAMIPIAVFCVTGVVGKDDLRQINWEVLWLFAGGFALGLGAGDTGLLKHVIDSIPFSQWPPLVIIIGAGVLCYVMSTFMSNTATAALLVPVLAAVAAGLGDTLTPWGGVTTLLVGVALSASLAMALPISTPPNAIAYASGVFTQKQMATVGLLVASVGMVLAYAMLILVGGIFFKGA